MQTHVTFHSLWGTVGGALGKVGGAIAFAWQKTVVRAGNSLADWQDDHPGTTAVIGLASLFAGKPNSEGPLEEEAGVAEEKISAAANAIENWLGEGYQEFESETSDLALRNEGKDWIKQVRFDLTKPGPNPPHVNIELFRPRNLYPGDPRWVYVFNKHIFLK
jgi:hypothetical protein